MRGRRVISSELVGAFVVEVDETGIGAERVGDVARDEREHLLEIERRIDGLDRLRQQTQVAFADVHEEIVAASAAPVTLWL
jgi:hypothetical protein